jgi:hypothetical protein
MAYPLPPRIIRLNWLPVTYSMCRRGETPNRFLNPGYADTDLTLKNTTRITERVNVELRLDTFNLFNRVNLMAVDPKLQDTTFGQSTSTYAARNMLLGARVNF